MLIFASHLHEERKVVQELADALSVFGVEVFVAHSSIEAGMAWHQEVLAKLDEADAGIAILHDRFNGSPWCAQEVGWLLGRKVPVVSLMFGLAPYGFLGERQGIDAARAELPIRRNSADREAVAMAHAVLGVLEKDERLLPAVLATYVGAIEGSQTFNNTDQTWYRLGKFRALDEESCIMLLRAVETKTQVYRSGHRDEMLSFLGQQPGVGAINDRLARAMDAARDEEAWTSYALTAEDEWSAWRRR